MKSKEPLSFPVFALLAQLRHVEMNPDRGGRGARANIRGNSIVVGQAASARGLVTLTNPRNQQGRLVQLTDTGRSLVVLAHSLARETLIKPKGNKESNTK